jgi:hypothetical protein
MPHSNKDAQRAYRAAWYRQRWATDAEFREAEAARRREWIEGGGRETVRRQVAAWRARNKKEAAKAKQRRRIKRS